MISLVCSFNHAPPNSAMPESCCLTAAFGHLLSSNVTMNCISKEVALTHMTDKPVFNANGSRHYDNTPYDIAAVYPQSDRTQMPSQCNDDKLV